ncbi:MAG: FAD-dependent oxidoreductase [Chloroflexi bacterium]|nr:FAD-dependent oxidoreductase [Chloroflexota bacterium]
MAANKVRLYICTGCGIGEALDAAALGAIAAQEYGAQVVTHPHLCGPEGGTLIREEREREGCQRLAIAACSGRVNAEVFTLDQTLVERINLREQVAWCHEPATEETQALATDQVRMGLVKLQKSDFPEPAPAVSQERVLVVGGGIAGLTAALEVANAGREVTLLEREPVLGGWLANFAYISPSTPPYREPQVPPLAEKVRAVQAHPRVQVLLGAEIEKAAGEPGAFAVTYKQNGNSAELGAAAIVLATGWEPYDATKLGHLGYGVSPNVITGVELEAELKNGGARLVNGRAPESVVFVQCAGSRDENHLPYCSSVCCQASLKQALLLRQQFPQANVFILHKDIRTPGQYEEFYKRVQEDPQIFFLRGEVASVAPDGGNLLVSATDTQLGRSVAVQADLVVLATGIVPRAAATLNLDYRQGPDVPSQHYCFADSNFICWPYETQRTGIFAAGCVREPQSVAGCIEDAAGAGLRAAQAVTLIKEGAALHPRVGDLYYPTFFLQRCTQCKRCTEECPFGALDEDAKGTPQLNANRCRRCGVCMGACPERLVSFKNYSIDIITSMIKAIEVPEDEDIQRILVLACENDAYPALDLAGARHSKYSAAVRTISLRCLGSTNVVFIADAVSRGIDGVLLLGCKYGDDYQCHFIKGSELASKRMDNVRETLGRLRVEPERVRLEQVTMDDWDRLPRLLDDFAAELADLGPNPYKGF